MPHVEKYKASRRGVLTALVVSAASAGLTHESAARELKEVVGDRAPRCILHVRVGSGDFEPTTEDLENVRDLFVDAVDTAMQESPRRAPIVATRHDIVVDVIDLGEVVAEKVG